MEEREGKKRLHAENGGINSITFKYYEIIYTTVLLFCLCFSLFLAFRLLLLGQNARFAFAWMDRMMVERKRPCSRVEWKESALFSANIKHKCI